MIDKQKSFPVLIVEDCAITNMIIDDVMESIDSPSIEHISANSREEALAILGERDDIRAVFLDWHLPDGTTEGFVDLIYATQKGVLEIITTSSDEKCRIRVLREGATLECEKYEIGVHLQRLAETHAQIKEEALA